MRTPITIAAAAIVLLFTLSGCSESSRPLECAEGDTRSCYTGPEGTAGRGICRSGTQTCRDGAWGACEGEVLPAEEICGDGVDNDCNGLDDGKRNACGGCAELEGEPGTACAGCGTWTCDGKEAVVCAEPTLKPGAACTGIDGCDGTWVCDEAEGQMVCDAPRKNACGKCGGPELTGKGEACQTASGCDGTLACSVDGESLFCEGPSKNICGVCGGPAVSGVGGTCAAANGCDGVLVCNAEGTGTECQQTTSKNECGKCGGPPVTGLGDSCSGPDGCSGVMVCSADGEEAVCNAPVKNNCGACGAPTIGGIGNACTSSEGCEGTLQCNDTGTGTQCQAPVKNQCGTCGGPDLPDAGTACVNEDGCEGTWVCSAGGTSLVCDAPARNACGICGVPVDGVGETCTAANGCEGTLVCNESGTGTVCTTELEKNECGVCGGPAVTGLGDACTNSDNCTGEMVCNAAGTAAVCNAPVINACGVCGPPVTDLGETCTAANTCDGVWMCSADNLSAECVTMLQPNECGLCGGDEVPNVGDDCIEAETGCAGILVCNDTKDGTFCDATCGANHVVISEVAAEGQGNANDEFVELYNPTGRPVDLSGWKLQYKSARGSSYSGQFELPQGSIIAPRGYFLLGSSAYRGSPAPDATWTTFNMARAGGHVRIGPNSMGTNKNDPDAVDTFGWGDADSPEGTRFSTLAAAAGSYERKARQSSTDVDMRGGGIDEFKGNGWDTDDNAADFVRRPTRQPQSTASPTERP